MTSLYPGDPPGSAVDDFSVPTSPESTPLSSGGGTDRNHPQLHDAEGAAIEELQRWAALRTHDHSGDPTKVDKGARLNQANTHEGADTDTPGGIHHHLGTGHEQAARGDHIHDYNGPTIINQPLLLCTSDARPLNPVVGTMIYEQDTNRVRAWSTFTDNVVVTGLNAIDNYTGTFTDGQGRVSMNPADWEQWYQDDPADPDHGAMGYIGGLLTWADEGSDTNRCIARRIKAADKETQSDDQVITWRTGDRVIEETVPIITEHASNDKYLRMNATRTSYLRLAVGNDWVKLFYTTSGPANEKLLGTLNFINTDTVRTEWRAQIKDRTFTIYRLGEQLGTIKDTKALSAKGAGFRGWATGMVAGDRLGGQTSPGDEDWVRIQDLSYFATANRWTLLSVAAVPVCRLRQSKTQKILTTGTIIEWTEEIEDTFGFFNSATQTDIIPTEAGLYQIEATIQWDPQFVPDVASMALMVNGVETTVKDQRFMRGNTFEPGFSQTLSVNGKLRLAVGDVLQVKAKYTAPASLLAKIFSYFDAPSKVNSRLDLHFQTP